MNAPANEIQASPAPTIIGTPFQGGFYTGRFRIGEFWPEQGGVYAGIMRGEKGQPDYHLIVAATDAGHVDEITWGSHGKVESGAESDSDGLANTMALIESKHHHAAAEWAGKLTIEGRSDWYLPARRELRLCWVNTPELFTDGHYWTSTQSSASYAWFQDAANGYQDYTGKYNELRGRAVRRSSVIQ